MTVRNLPLTAGQVARAMGICRRGTSRKIERMEQVLELLLAAVAAETRSGRADRIRTAVVEHLQAMATLAAAHPDAIEPWVDRLLAG